MLTFLAARFGALYDYAGAVIGWIALIAWFRSTRPFDMVAQIVNTFGLDSTPVTEAGDWLAQFSTRLPEDSGTVLPTLLLVGSVMLIPGTATTLPTETRAGYTAGYLLLLCLQLGVSILWVPLAVGARLFYATFISRRDSQALDLQETAENFVIGGVNVAITPANPIVWALGSNRTRSTRDAT